MTLRMAVLAACVLLMASLPALAADERAPATQAAPAQAACLVTVLSPPCGYIVPQISLDFPDKPTCRAATLGGPIDLAQCLALPAVGSVYEAPGAIVFSWDITQDGVYPIDLAQPIVISFSGTATNPPWMTVTTIPAEITLDATALVDPNNLVVDLATQKVMFHHEESLTLRFERKDVGDDEKTLTRLERSQGAVQTFLKAKSSASGQYYKEAFGVEEFRFNPCVNDDALAHAVAQCDGLAPGGASSKDAPAYGLLAPVAVLGAFALALRRRGA